MHNTLSTPLLINTTTTTSYSRSSSKSHDYEMLRQEDYEYDDNNDNEYDVDGLSPLSIEMRIPPIKSINIENILHSLASVNTFTSKRNEQPILLYEITSFGESSYKTMTLRDLLQYLNEEASDIDDDYTNEMFLRDERPISFSPPPHTSSPHKKEKHHTQPSSSPSVYKMSPSKSTESMKSPLLMMKRRSSVKRVPTTPLLYSSSNPLHQNYGSFQPPSTPPRQSPSKQHQIPPQLRPKTPRNSHSGKKRRSSKGSGCDCHLIRSLRLRDLRRLDASISLLNETAIIVRRHSVIFAMDPIRAVITATKVLLVLPDGADSLIAILDHYIKEWIDLPQSTTTSHQSMISLKSASHPSFTGFGGEDVFRNRFKRHQRKMNLTIDSHDFWGNKTPFEVHAYEALLLTAKEMESQRLKQMSDRIEELLLHYRQGTLISLEVQSELRSFKAELTAIQNRLESCCEALQNVLEDVDEMALMNLSFLKEQPFLYQFPLDKAILSQSYEIEEMIESYLTDFHAVIPRILLLKHRIQTAEEQVKLRLDTAQNQLLFADFFLFILNSCLGFGNYFVGIFGMNLDQTIYLQPRYGSFIAICIISLILVILLYGFLFLYFQWAMMVIPMNYKMMQVIRSGGSGGTGGISSGSSYYNRRHEYYSNTRASQASSTSSSSSL